MLYPCKSGWNLPNSSWDMVHTSTFWLKFGNLSPTVTLKIGLKCHADTDANADRIRSKNNQYVPLPFGGGHNSPASIQPHKHFCLSVQQLKKMFFFYFQHSWYLKSSQNLHIGNILLVAIMFDGHVEIITNVWQIRFIARFLFVQCSCAIRSSIFVISEQIFELSYWS